MPFFFIFIQKEIDKKQFLQIEMNKKLET